MAKLRSQTGPLSCPPTSSIEASNTHPRPWDQEEVMGYQNEPGYPRKAASTGGIRRQETTGETSAASISVLGQVGRPFLASPCLLQAAHQPSRTGSRSIPCLRDAACGVQPPQDRAGRRERGSRPAMGLSRKMNLVACGNLPSSQRGTR